MNYNYTCKNRLMSFNKASDEMKSQAIKDGMKISYEETTPEGFNLFYAERRQTWTPENGHEPYFGLYSMICAKLVDFGSGDTRARIEYAHPVPYGHARIYMKQFNQG